MKLSSYIALFLCLLSTSVMAQNVKQSYVVKCQIVNYDSSEIENSSAYLYTSNGGLRFLIAQDGSRFKTGSYTLFANASGYFEYSTIVEITSDTTFYIVLKENIVEHSNVTVKATQVREKSGFVFSKLNSRQIASNNLGQDFTYLLANTPSAYSTSDAGTGIGYTGIRIRGSDGTRINVSVNGIPINDAESHGVFWVNMPDLASSASLVQIQRGVGSSTIGSGAFGANINVANTELNSNPFVRIQQSIGSFNTSRSTLQFGTGKISNFNFGGRLSRIVSDGYVDRGSSNLLAFQFNLDYSKKKWNIHLVSFGGKEKTYQSWYGTPESRVRNDIDGMNAFADRNYLSDADRQNLLNSGRTYNYYTYKNQTDNYWQNHYQMHIAKELNPNLWIKSSFFLTSGKGYFEEFKPDASYNSYGVNDFIVGTDTSSNTDLVRQRWLDNTYFGNFTSVNYKKKSVDLIGGLSYTKYNGKHFGDVIWAEIAQPFGKDYRYYQSKSTKEEINAFVKGNYKVNKKLQIDLEMQSRIINYKGLGNDNDLKKIDFDTNYLFLNPKAALVYELNKGQRLYGSYSIGQREPVRSDFIDQTRSELPKPEFMRDIEIGYILKKKTTFFQFNFYDMAYKNQLVLTGELNDVGSSLRKNVAKSYRRGIELVFQREIIKKMFIDANLNLSSNKIIDFEDVYYNYDDGSIVKNVYSKTDIAFSPSAIGYIGVTDKHIRGLELKVDLKYVGEQYLDNTLNKDRKIDAYSLFNFSFQKAIQLSGKGHLTIRGMVNNVFGIFYSNNGYTYKYVYDGKLIVENFYYPQSRTNFMLGVDFTFL